MVSERRTALCAARGAADLVSRVAEIITLIGSHNLLATPSETDFDDPALRDLIGSYLRGAKDIGSRDRARIFRLAWDFVGSSLASRNELYERFYLASGVRNYQLAHTLAPKERAKQLVDQLLGLAPGTDGGAINSRHHTMNLPPAAPDCARKQRDCTQSGNQQVTTDGNWQT